MKPITKQLIAAVFVLALVTVASLGIRHIRFSTDRAGTVESPVVTESEPDPLPAEPETVDPEPEPQYAEVPELEEEPSEKYAGAKRVKGDYAMAKGSKGLEKVSIGDNENLYRTAEGELWYVGEGPDGRSFKMQVQVDEATGEMSIVGKVYNDKGGGSESYQKMSIGGNDNIYITEEGRAWYVTDGYKAQVEIYEATGTITVIEQHGDGDDK